MVRSDIEFFRCLINCSRQVKPTFQNLKTLTVSTAGPSVLAGYFTINTQLLLEALVTILVLQVIDLNTDCTLVHFDSQLNTSSAPFVQLTLGQPNLINHTAPKPQVSPSWVIISWLHQWSSVPFQIVLPWINDLNMAGR